MQRGDTLIGRFRDRVERAPDAVAVAAGPLRWTYAGLARRAEARAARLAAAGVGVGDLVGVDQERSPDLLVTLLAVLRTGAAYVPVDGRLPPPARAGLLDAAGVAAVVTDARPDSQAGGRPVLRAGTDHVGGASEATGPPSAAQLDAGLLAYVMHTSGSTGRSKGVATTHANVVDLATDPGWGVGPRDRVLFHAPHAFDAASYEIWVPLLAGARIVVAPPAGMDALALRRLVGVEGLTHVHLTAGLFRVVAHDDPGCLDTVREVLTGGDVVSPAAVRALRAALPGVVVRHLYGPTEVTLCAIGDLIAPGDPHPDGPLPIGRPLRGTVAHVLDAGLRPAAEGELYLAGPRVARGYLGAPALTAERFVPDPAGPPGTRMYRTGDLARRRPDGAFDFLGRVDDQVKVRGFRVEPGHLEVVLAGHDRVAQAAVVVRRDRRGDVALVAYVVPAGDAAGLDDDLTAYARSQLPAQLVPAAVSVVSALPLTRNGKLDRDRLPDPFAPGTAGRPATVPSARGPDEALLRELFGELTGAREVGPDDDFFALGGHSLLAAGLVSRIAARTGVELSLETVVDSPTPAALARYLER
jgi:amino acid adenylation domain-containing protein